MTINYLLLTGIFIYITNYLIGWLLHFRIISMTRGIHSVFFAAIIINLILILIFVNLTSVNLFFCSVSLIAMVILPLGRKGGRYHQIISTLGLLFFLFVFINF